MTDLAYERVQTHLMQLKLQSMAAYVDTVAEEAAQHEWTYLAFLDRLLDLEASARYQRDVAMKTKLAHFPFFKTLDEFDFSFQPSISERQVRELATMRFLAHGENILLLGPPGVGKTHLAIALGVAAIAQRNVRSAGSRIEALTSMMASTKASRGPPCVGVSVTRSRTVWLPGRSKVNATTAFSRYEASGDSALPS
jgi:DNA replication protein DnaC